jgi:cytochrome c-type biogenesis protein CcmF
LSRESVFLGNNVLLLVLTFTVLIGTIYPLLAEAVTGGKVSVGSPFFNRNTAPVALLLLFLMGIGPLLPWRAASASAVLRRLQVPMWAAAATAAILALAGAGVVAVIVFGLAAFVATATVAEMVRGVQAQRRAHAISVGAAIRAAVSRNHRLYGGLVVHLGLIVAVVGVSWAALSDRSSEVTIAQGEIVHVQGYDLRFDRLTTRQEPQRRVLVAELTVLDPESGQEVVRLQPSLNLYPAASEPIGTPSIRFGTPFNGMLDLYASLVTVENGTRASFRFFANPGIGLLWFGGAVMTLGGIVAAWPSRRRPASLRGPEPLAERREEVTV